MAELIIENLVRTFGEARAVDDVSLHVRDGEFVTLLGPSGCGKSTTLAAIAGLDRPDGGEIRAGSRVFFSSRQNIYLPPEARNCGLVFQSYALWPHMTVRDNVAFPLRLRKQPAAIRNRRIAEVLALVEMEPYADRYPHQLSGGQQQRVALARTLAYEPEILLLDEPLSNLDAKLRDRARAWLAELRTKVRVTTIYVTHDQIEALALSDRIVVMNKGRIAQVGTPQEIYETPADPFVADFIGTTNFIEGTAQPAGGTNPGWTVQLPDGQHLDMSASCSLTQGERVTVALRPVQMRLLSPGESPTAGTAMRGRVVTQSYVGGRWQVGLMIGGATVRLETDDRQEEEEARIWVPQEGAILFGQNGGLLGRPA